MVKNDGKPGVELETGELVHINWALQQSHFNGEHFSNLDFSCTRYSTYKYLRLFFSLYRKRTWLQVIRSNGHWMCWSLQQLEPAMQFLPLVIGFSILLRSLLWLSVGTNNTNKGLLHEWVLLNDPVIRVLRGISCIVFASSQACGHYWSVFLLVFLLNAFHVTRRVPMRGGKWSPFRVGYPLPT